MNFIEAVKLVKNGKKVRRSVWGKYEYIEPCDLDTNNKWSNGCYKTDYEEILATDWEIYKEEKIKTYNFIEAVKLTKEGKRIGRPGWSNYEYLDSRCFDKNNWCAYQTNYEEVTATDWIIIDEE